MRIAQTADEISLADAAGKHDEPDTLKAPTESSDVLAGSPVPWGAHERGDGVNFALFSRHATSVRPELHQSA